MLTTKNLLSVKCITPKLVKQIARLDFDPKPDSTFGRILESLTSHDNAPLAWMWQRDADPNSSQTSLRRLWLVKSGPNYYLIPAPDRGSNLDTLHSPTLEQLFVS